jgi:serine/threonine protein kinase
MATKIATMRTLKPHPNMLQLHDVFEDEEGFHVVLEYCKGAALLEQIHNRVRPWALSCTFRACSRRWIVLLVWAMFSCSAACVCWGE